ncbi:MAG: YoaK family protein [Mycobacteriaceae bacterium]|uniref:YoaK family protein n=1 Tax=Corynebacterium sp. TaxID=1720 RepID=UPI003F9D1D30
MRLPDILPPSHPALGPYHDRREMLLGILLAALAGAVGAAAWSHSSGWYVTFMTGNTELMVLEHYQGEHILAFSALATIAAFILGVMAGTFARLRLWSKSRHGATLVTVGATYVAFIIDLIANRSNESLGVIPILSLAFGLGALNTAVSHRNQVQMPLSYVTGTLVKMGQGFALHLFGDRKWVWVSQFVTYAGFLGGIISGGAVFHTIGTHNSLAAIALMSTIASVVTWKLDHPRYATQDSAA